MYPVIRASCCYTTISNRENISKQKSEIMSPTYSGTHSGEECIEDTPEMPSLNFNVAAEEELSSASGCIVEVVFCKGVDVTLTFDAPDHLVAFAELDLDVLSCSDISTVDWHVSVV